MLRYLVAFAALFAMPAPAFAWWEYGHEVVARIAWLETTPRARAEMRRLMALQARLDTPTCPVRTIEEASVWADCIKPLGDRFSYQNSWHYQNVHICRDFDQAAACRDGNCVSAQIERNARLLADRSLPDRERLMALAFLVHFVGDLHMPLHAGDRGDLGGNRVPVSYGLIEGRTNLHSAWDGYIAERAISTPAAGARGLLSELTPDRKAVKREGTVTDWARESWEISRRHAYGTIAEDPCAAMPEGRPVIGEEDVQRLIPVVRTQVARAGLRLARLLDEALG
ncbi:MAG: S1/P1 nuclease [Allosphingosinicella sp.]|uniref:S1/P1 nuclease n=1 Tax=Allosphingosinicella sp. TaxID=2823234 RepID=UPI00395895B7